MSEERPKPDITLEQAIAKTKDAGFQVSFDKGQTIAGDLFELKQDIRKIKADAENELANLKQDISKANSEVQRIWWFFGAIIIACTIATVLIIADYLQFTSKAYQQFTEKLEAQSTNVKNLETLSPEIKKIVEELVKLDSKIE